jgi:uncharacterized protein (DUF4415 family)
MPATDRASRPEADNPEWTEAMAVAAVRLEALPEGLQRKLRGRPRAAVTKQRTTLRLSREVLEQFRATGPGWQTRIDIALKDWLEGRGRLG